MQPLKVTNCQNFNWTDKYRFPVGAVLLILFQLLSGMGAYCYILAMPIYMASILGFTDTQSTIIYHAKSTVSYLINIVGAVIADSLLGRVKTYFAFQPFDIAIMVGIAIMSIYNQMIGIVILYFILAIVGGLVTPALRTVIADQIPTNNPVMLSSYLHIIYLINNFGVIIVAYVAPILHKDIFCFGRECYPLVFIVSLLLTLSSFCLFLSGYCCGKFVVNKPTNNLFMNIIRCISISITRRIKFGKPANGKSTLDYAEGEFDESFIRDMKIAKGLLIFLLAHPLFWMVFEQVSSIWTLQAQYMDGMMSKSYVIKPDQMQTLNPVLVVILIPIFEVAVYPIFNRINFQVPYRITLGQIFTALACVSMIFIQIQIDTSARLTIASGQRQINIANFGRANVTIISGSQIINMTKAESVLLTVDSESHVIFKTDAASLNRTFHNASSISSVVFVDSNVTSLDYVNADVKVQQNGGYAFVRALNLVVNESDIDLVLKAKIGINKICTLKSKIRIFGDYVKCSVGEFDVFMTVAGGEKILGTITLYPAESKTLIIDGHIGSAKMTSVRELLLKLPNILWQIVPYIFVTMGEVLFNVNTGIFLYGEAPMSMKSIIVAGQYVCISIGNILIILLKEILKNISMTYLFLICGILVAFSGILTGILGYIYLQNKKLMDSEIEVHSSLTSL